MSTTPTRTGGTTPPLSVRALAPDRLASPREGLGLTWRPLGPADRDVLGALVSRVEAHDEPPYRTTGDELRELFEGAWKDPEHNSLGGFDAVGVLRAEGFVQVFPGDRTTVRAFLDGGVDPDWRRRGVGSALMSWQVARARQLLAATGLAVPGRIATYVDNHLTDKSALVRRLGFEPRRFSTDLRRDLSLPIPEVALRHGLRLVRWSPDLDEQVRLAHNEAFADRWGSEPHTPESWSEVRAGLAEDWSFVVVDHSTDRSPVAGYLLSGRYEQDWESLGYREGYVDLLGVRREWRGRRVATALLTTAMRAYRDAGMQFAALGVDADTPSGSFGIFAALGFEPARGSAMYTIEI